jgi:hypothetical protein
MTEIETLKGQFEAETDPRRREILSNLIGEKMSEQDYREALELTQGRIKRYELLLAE